METSKRGGFSVRHPYTSNRKDTPWPRMAAGAPAIMSTLQASSRRKGGMLPYF